MPIHIIHHDKKSHETQVSQYEEIITYFFAVSLACYVGKISKLRILCGSI